MANPIPDQNASEGTAFSFQFAANAFSDPDGDALTYAATLVGGGSLPAWLTFTPSTRTFSGTPGPGDFADLSIRVTATDPGSLSAHDDFLVAVNGKPVVANPIPDQQAAYNAAFSFQFASNAFTDPDGDALIYSADLSDGSPLPIWLTFTPATRTFSGTPALAELGTLQVRVTASDGSLQTTDVFSLEAVFKPANDPLASCLIDKYCTANLFDDGSATYTGVLDSAPAPTTGSWRIESITDRSGGKIFTAPSVAERVTWNHSTKRFEGAGARRLIYGSGLTPGWSSIFSGQDYTVFADLIRSDNTAQQWIWNFGANSSSTSNNLHLDSANTMLFSPRRPTDGATDNRLTASGFAISTRYLVECYIAGQTSRLLRDATVVASKSNNNSVMPTDAGSGFAIFGRNVTDSGNYMRGSSAGIWIFKGGVTAAFEAAMRAWVSGTFV